MLLFQLAELIKYDPVNWLNEAVVVYAGANIARDAV